MSSFTGTSLRKKSSLSLDHMFTKTHGQKREGGSGEALWVFQIINDYPCPFLRRILFLSQTARAEHFYIIRKTPRPPTVFIDVFFWIFIPRQGALLPQSSPSKWAHLPLSSLRKKRSTPGNELFVTWAHFCCSNIKKKATWRSLWTKF